LDLELIDAVPTFSVILGLMFVTAGFTTGITVSVANLFTVLGAFVKTGTVTVPGLGLLATAAAPLDFIILGETD